MVISKCGYQQARDVSALTTFEELAPEGCSDEGSQLPVGLFAFMGTKDVHAVAGANTPGPLVVVTVP